jgi:hypothetical protein
MNQYESDQGALTKGVGVGTGVTVADSVTAGNNCPAHSELPQQSLRLQRPVRRAEPLWMTKQVIDVAISRALQAFVAIGD